MLDLSGKVGICASKAFCERETCLTDAYIYLEKILVFIILMFWKYKIIGMSS